MKTVAVAQVPQAIYKNATQSQATVVSLCTQAKHENSSSLSSTNKTADSVALSLMHLNHYRTKRNSFFALQASIA